MNWSELVLAFLGGGVFVKVVEVFASTLKEEWERRKSARIVVNEHLDPLLKAADELVGKTRSLAKYDFSKLTKSSDKDSELEVRYYAYLIAQIWARLQILRHEALYVDVNKNKKGRMLQEFVATLETRRIRLLERPLQRGIGEALIERSEDRLRSLTFYEFIGRMDGDKAFQQWMKPLLDVLENMHWKSNQQRILMYGIVVHAMVDTLDPKHAVTRDGPSWPNKLWRKNSRELRERVFGFYLNSTRCHNKYHEKKGPPH